MPPASKSASLARYLPHVLLATFSVAVLPFLAVYGLETAGVLTSAIAAAVTGVLLSVLLARLGAFLWMRHGGSKDLVFGDLMLWGFVRRLRTEKRAWDSLRLLGLDRSGKPVREVEMAPGKRAEILRDLAHRLELGDPFTQGHTRRVTRYAYMIAKTMGLPGDTVRTIRAAASVHDVGKIETPQEILNKPGALTDEEFEIMKRHSVTGAEMVSKLGDPEITEMVRHHHERMDGRGYPDRLKGTDIPLGARVIAVADTFDAIISTRPYRAARRHKEAIEIIKRSAGTQLDEHAVNAFLSYYSGRKPLAWWLSLSTAFQRVFGGFGGWLQHAQAGSLSHGTASLAAAIMLTTGAVAVHPAPVEVERHSAPIVALDNGSGSRDSVGTVALGAPAAVDAEPVSPATNDPGAADTQIERDESAVGDAHGQEAKSDATSAEGSETDKPAGNGRPVENAPDEASQEPATDPPPPVVETPTPPVDPPPPAPPVEKPGEGKDKDKDKGKDKDKKTKGSCDKNGDSEEDSGNGEETTGDEGGPKGRGGRHDDACKKDDDKGKDKDKGEPGDKDDDKGKDGDKDKGEPGDKDDKDKGTKDDEDELEDGDVASDDSVEGEDDPADDADDGEDVEEAPVSSDVADEPVQEPVVVETEPIVVEAPPPAVEPEPIVMEGDEPTVD